MSSAAIIEDIKKRMEGAISSFQHELKGIRAGRATPNILDGVAVEAYGSKMPLAQMATVSALDAKTISVQVWDNTQTKVVEKAISNSGLGLNPSSEGTVIRIALPELSEERRKELVKVTHKYGEQAKVAVRNVRRDGMDALKKAEKDGGISEDEVRGKSDEIQKITDNNIKKIDEFLVAKEKEIMQV